MPFVGLGLRFMIALFFAVHALRSRQQRYRPIIFSFPLLGSAAYFLVVFFPNSH